MPRSALPSHLQDKKHNDWPFLFSWVSRNWTSFKLTQPPHLICGSKVFDYTSRKFCKTSNRTVHGPDPTQKCAWAWALTWPLHFTFTFGKTGYYFRIGCRWDTIDEYYTIPAIDITKVGGGVQNEEKDRIIYRGHSRWAK